MNKIFSLCCAILMGISVFAQSPQKMSYQCVVRNSSGALVSNQAVGVRISLLQGSATGTLVYQETFSPNPQTNANGLLSVEIGTGTPVSGSFSSVNWAAGPYFLKTETDPAGGTTYTITGTNQLLSVPYALYAKDVQNNNDADASPTNEIQSLTLSGTTLGITSGNTVTLPAPPGDNWGSQVVMADATLSGNGTTATPLKVADGGINSAKIADATIVAADLATNSVTTDKINAGAVTGAKIAQAGATSGQVLKWSGTTWAPAADATGGSSSGWTDDGQVVRLTTTTDTVQIGSGKRLGRFNVGGDIGLNLLNSIYFGGDATRITSLTGGDLRFVAEDLSMLTTEDITFGRFGDATWIKFDNANKRVGIGTLSPTDKLHVVLDNTAAGLSAVRGVATSAAGSAYGVYGQSAGFKGRGVMGEATGTSSIGVMGLATNTSSTGVWGEGSNQGVYGKSDLATGKGVFGQVTSATGYSGYFDGGKFYISGNTGIGTTTPAKKLHVYGSAQVKDTLYANVVNASKITTMPGIAHSMEGNWMYPNSLTSSWAALNSVTVNVPAPGYVLLIASCGIGSDHTSLDVTSVYLGVSKTSDGTGVKQIARWFVSNSVETGYINEIISSQAPLQVTSAGSQTFYLMAYRTTGDDYDMAASYMTNLTAIYFPVAYGTVE